MSVVADAELFSVGTEEAVVTFTTAPDVAVTTRVGGEEVGTVGPRHVVRVAGLGPGTEYELVVEGAAPSAALPPSFRTLDRPPGRHAPEIARL